MCISKFGAEQAAAADLLAVMLFAKVWYVVEQKVMPAGASSLAPPLVANISSRVFSLTPNGNINHENDSH